jgi:dTDP-4-amino-4,6-dideoxygalactose transaminase
MIPLVKPYVPAEDKLLPELKKVLYSGYLAQGERVEEFETSFRNFIGDGYSVSVNSGTSALHIALILAGVERGSEVISTALTAEPTNVAIKMTGALIRYADIDYSTGNISPTSIEEKINEKTSAIVVVDYAGTPVNIKKLQEISEKYRIPVIEDAAHALGATMKGIKTGNFFPYTVFSFQAIKHMTTIDGGILHLASKEDYEKAKLIRWFGIDKNVDRLKNNIQLQGYKYHMNDVIATMGLVQLESIQGVIDAYIDNGEFYDKALSGIHGINTLTHYDGSKPSYWLYTMKVDDRAGLIKKLSEKGIMASPLHTRNDCHDFLNDFSEKLPVLDKFYEELLHIPCGWWVSKEDREQIINIIKSGW